MQTRHQQLIQWLEEVCRFSPVSLQAMVGDASFRQYYRLHHEDTSYVVMDAPLETENSASFVLLSQLLSDQGLTVPRILFADLTMGFLLISDLGLQTLLPILNPKNADHYYKLAMNDLHRMQAMPIDSLELPRFLASFMKNELLLCKEWFLEKHLGLVLSDVQLSLLDDFFTFVANAAADQPYTFMHRDYHSGNIMVLDENHLGILDFQDAFIGPYTYDLVSLLKDSYIAHEPEKVLQWADQFYEGLFFKFVSKQEFLMHFDIMGLQRHLKVLLTVARKYRRDDNPNYLQHIPRILSYIEDVLPRFPQALAFQTFFQDVLIPQFHKVTLPCAQ